MRSLRNTTRITEEIRTFTLIALLLILQLAPALAWVFPEHRDIAVLAVQQLDPDRQAQLQKVWAEARAGFESRLCEPVAQTSQGAKPDCIDYAAWTAIAGDHSCSARDMLNSVLNAPWILGVARVGARLQTQLASSTRRDQRVNAVRDSDIALERTDPEYVTRATSNDAHFLLARPSIAMQPEEYARFALGSQAGLNALATYVWYHQRALYLAAAISRGKVPDASRSLAVRVALADEAFGLHFLEDSFAAGHVTGNWGKSAVRKGTHDYYSEHGVSLVTWSGHAFVAAGDAYMQPEDAERSAAAVRDSLAQLIDTFAGKFELGDVGQAESAGPETFDVCRESHLPSAAGTHGDLMALVPIVVQTPVPALSAGRGEFPRFRAELGTFVGLSSAFRSGALSRGFGATQTDVYSTAGLESAARFGIGLEGVLNESSDGLVFVEVGAREDRHASGAATVPGRGALTTRLRMPFWLIPGDLLLAGPVLAFTSKTSLTKMAVQAANGGLIPWQAGIATRFGRLQFMFGREVSASFYHNNSDHPFIIPTPGVPPVNVTLVALKSVQIEFPILEYRLFRTFSLNQSSGLMIQPFIGFDQPTSSSVVSPAGVSSPHLHTIVTTGLRVVFDWRHYLK
jgi:hypothetical protein